MPHLLLGRSLVRLWISTVEPGYSLLSVTILALNIFFKIDLYIIVSCLFYLDFGLFDHFCAGI